MKESPFLGPRTAFQRGFVSYATGKILNVGCSDDPMGLGKKAYPPGLDKDVVHFDLDWWRHTQFVQGDAHNLIFRDKAFEMVVMGDVHEHLYDPVKASLECFRVSAKWVVWTIFEEWRLPGHGQFTDIGRQQGLAETKRVTGYNDYAEKMAADNPEVVLVDDAEVPHHSHINQFTDADILNLVTLGLHVGFKCTYFLKAEEAEYEGHKWSNWLVAMERPVA